MTAYKPTGRSFSSDFTANIALDLAAIEAFCQKWNVAEISFFGSVLREDFGEESDIDVLISFGENGALGLLDKMAAREELEAMLGRSVDLVTKSGLSIGLPLHLSGIAYWQKRRLFMHTCDMTDKQRLSAVRAR